MDLGLNGKAVVVTGATSGIGYETALCFAREGAKVAICARSEEGIARAIETSAQLGLTLIGKRCDVGEEGDVAQLMQWAAKHLGAIDVLVNNAGIVGKGAPLVEGDEEEFDRIIGINLKGAWLGCKHAVPYMRKGGGGVILNTSSYAAVMPSAGGGMYAVSKAGLNMLTQSLAQELGADNIRVNAVIPGRIETPMAEKAHKEHPRAYLYPIALGRFGQTQDVAQLMVFLASDAASYITGQCIRACGGKFISQPLPEELL